MAEAASGGRSLVFTVYPYPDHSRLVVTLARHKPLTGRSMVLGSIRLDLGREALAGLDAHVAVRLVAVSILNALADPADTKPGPEDPGAPLGATGVAGQLRLDLPV